MSKEIIRKQVRIATPDGDCDSYVFFPVGEQRCPAVLFYMDGLGLREDLFAMAERLASKDYYVLLPNLYYRAGDVPAIDAEKAFVEGPEQTRVMTLMQGLTMDGVMSDTAAFLAFLDLQSEVEGDKLACIGYCMGGQYSLASAARFGDRVVAAAIVHGAALATENEQSPHLLADKIKASLYVAIAKIDPWFNDADKDRLKSALDAAGVKYKLESFPAVHGFAVNGTPAYERRWAEQHWVDVFFLFRKAFGRK